MRKPVLASLAWALLSPCIAAAAEQADALAILGKAIKAKGEEAAMRKVVAVHATFNTECYGLDIGWRSRDEVYQQGLDKWRTVSVFSFPDTGKHVYTEVVNGKVGWIKRDRDETIVMAEAELASRRDSIDIYLLGLLVPLSTTQYRLSPIGESTVAGRKAVGILVRHDKHDAVKLYFDKETHLLAKSERGFKDGHAASGVHEETVFSDYRTVQGFKQPYKMEMYRDGRKAGDATVLNIEFSEKPFDDKLFVKP